MVGVVYKPPKHVTWSWILSPGTSNDSATCTMYNVHGTSSDIFSVYGLGVTLACTRAIFGEWLPLHQIALWCSLQEGALWCSPAPDSALAFLAGGTCKAGSVSITSCRQVGPVPNMTRVHCRRKQKREDAFCSSKLLKNSQTAEI